MEQERIEESREAGRPGFLSRHRPALEMLFFFAAVLFFMLFALSLVEAQAALFEDRAGLVKLREGWAAAAVGYGLRGGARESSEYFITEYRLFRSRPSVKELIAADPELATLASSADSALARLATAEIRGDVGASRAAASFEQALALMAARVGVYSRDSLDRSRLTLFALAAALIGLGGSFLALERRLLLQGRDERRSRALSRALIAAAEGERLRISRELHDAVAQDLAAARLYAGLAGGPDAAKAGELLGRAIGEVRDICHGLRPAELDRLGLAEASERLCAEVAREADLELDFRAEGLGGLRLEPEIEINFYRILQEALSNVRRHSGSSRAAVRLAFAGEILSLEVEDSGRGPGSAPPGLGRTGMEERARMLGGEFAFGATARGGAFLRVRAPARAIREVP